MDSPAFQEKKTKETAKPRVISITEASAPAALPQQAALQPLETLAENISPPQTQPPLREQEEKKPRVLETNDYSLLLEKPAVQKEGNENEAPAQNTPPQSSAKESVENSTPDPIPPQALPTQTSRENEAERAIDKFRRIQLNGGQAGHAQKFAMPSKQKIAYMANGAVSKIRKLFNLWP